MDWEDVIKKNQKTSYGIPAQSSSTILTNKPSTSLRGKLRSDNQPLPDDDENECYEWLLELKRIMYEPYIKSFNNIFRMKDALSQDEDFWCEIKRMLENEKEYHFYAKGFTEFGLNYNEYGNLWDLNVFGHSGNEPEFNMDISFGTIPESESMETRYPYVIPWIMTQYIIVLQADADKDINLQTTKHIILDEWEKEINKNLDKFNLFFNYIGNKELRQEFYYKLIRDVIEYLYQNQKDKIEDESVFNRVYHYFMSIITTKM